jgi:protein-disulfide isomerase
MKFWLRFLIFVLTLGFGSSVSAQLSYPPARFAQAFEAKLNGSSFKLGTSSIKLEVVNGLVSGLSYTGATDDVKMPARVIATALEHPENAAGLEMNLKNSANRFRDVGTVSPGLTPETVLELRWAKTFVFRLNLKRFSGFGPDRHVMGRSGVMIREFSDFECPFCKQLMLETMPSLRSRFVDKGLARFAFHHLPLTSIHPKALKAGIAAECAGAQRKFFAYHDLLFALGLNDFQNLARITQLNVAVFNQCLKSISSKETVFKEARYAAALQINATPTVFVGPFKLANANDLNAYARYLQMAKGL